jgi:hypothetical protein
MLLVPLIASAALLAGCTRSPEVAPSPSATVTTNGVEALEAEAILDRAREAVEEAESIKASGEAEAEDGATLTFELVYVGDDAQGTANVFGVEAELIKIGPDVYIKADPALFAAFVPEEQQPLLAALTGKWVQIDASLVVVFVPVQLAATDWLEPVGAVSKGDITTVNGTQAITLEDSDGSQLFVAIEGEPYPLQLVAEGAMIEFSDFDEEVEVEAPPATDVIDIMAMLGLG